MQQFHHQAFVVDIEQVFQSSFNQSLEANEDGLFSSSASCVCAFAMLARFLFSIVMMLSSSNVDFKNAFATPTAARFGRAFKTNEANCLLWFSSLPVYETPSIVRNEPSSRTERTAFNFLLPSLFFDLNVSRFAICFFSAAIPLSAEASLFLYCFVISDSFMILGCWVLGFEKRN